MFMLVSIVIMVYIEYRQEKLKKKKRIGTTLLNALYFIKSDMSLTVVM